MVGSSGMHAEYSFIECVEESSVAVAAVEDLLQEGGLVPVFVLAVDLLEVGVRGVKHGVVRLDQLTAGWNQVFPLHITLWKRCEVLGLVDTC